MATGPGHRNSSGDIQPGAGLKTGDFVVEENLGMLPWNQSVEHALKGTPQPYPSVDTWDSRRGAMSTCRFGTVTLEATFPQNMLLIHRYERYDPLIRHFLRFFLSGSSLEELFSLFLLAPKNIFLYVHYTNENTLQLAVRSKILSKLIFASCV